jgi:retron-type reverse transcriptase
MTLFPTKPVPPILPPSPYEQVVGYDKIEAAYKRTLRGKHKFKKEAVLYDMCRERNNVQLWRELRTDAQTGRIEYRPRAYHSITIYEPKERLLNIPKLRDKIVQLVIHEEIQNLFRPVFVDRSFACQYGKGSIRAAFSVFHDMRVAQWKWGEDAFVVKLDIRKFFYSIDREVLKKLIRKRMKELKKKHPELSKDFDRFLTLLDIVIDSSPEGKRGIPLGNVSSQDFANVYLNEVDQLCLRHLGIRHYTRCADDIVIVAPNRATAKRWLLEIVAFIRKRLHIEINKKKTKLYPLKQGVNAYGFKIKTTHLELRTESKRKAKRRVKKMGEKVKAGELSKEKFIQDTQSWLGFARWASAYTLCLKIFAPYPYIKVEGEMQFGSIFRSREARRILQQRYNPAPTHKTVEE